MQIIFHREPEHFTLDDGFQEPLTLVSPHREILGATFHKFVLRNIGGSEKFQDKQNFFYSKLREHHHRQNRSEKKVLVHRADLLESVRERGGEEGGRGGLESVKGGDRQICHIFQTPDVDTQLREFSNPRRNGPQPHASDASYPCRHCYRYVCMSILQARRATKGFSPHDWCRKFCIVFKGEEGMCWTPFTRAGGSLVGPLLIIVMHVSLLE